MARGSVAPTAISKTSSHRNETRSKFQQLKTFCLRQTSRGQKNLTTLKLNLINQSINSETNVYIAWSFIVAMVSLYNMWAIPLRWAFQLDSSKPWIYTNKNFWLPLDYFSDLVFIIDVLYVWPKIETIKEGSVVTNAKELRKCYFSSMRFKLDLVAILPFDVLFFFLDWHNGWWQLLRINRFLRNGSYFNFLNKCEQLLPNPYVFRIIKTLINLLYVIHITTCLYFAMSTFSGIGSNSWAYDGVVETKYVSAYIRCFYWALKTVTSIGNERIPTNKSEIVFSMMNYLGMLTDTLSHFFHSYYFKTYNFNPSFQQTRDLTQSLVKPY